MNAERKQTSPECGIVCKTTDLVSSKNQCHGEENERNWFKETKKTPTLAKYNT